MTTLPSLTKENQQRPIKSEIHYEYMLYSLLTSFPFDKIKPQEITNIVDCSSKMHIIKEVENSPRDNISDLISPKKDHEVCTDMLKEILKNRI